ncbi:MAG: hypothetical protein RL417_29 [Pseudomonadota bacterium]
MRVDPEKNKGRVTVRFPGLSTTSSGKIERVTFHVYCINSDGARMASENNPVMLNKVKGRRFVRGLVKKLRATRPVVIY